MHPAFKSKSPILPIRFFSEMLICQGVHLYCATISAQTFLFHSFRRHTFINFVCSPFRCDQNGSNLLIMKDFEIIQKWFIENNKNLYNKETIYSFFILALISAISLFLYWKNISKISILKYSVYGQSIFFKQKVNKKYVFQTKLIKLWTWKNKKIINIGRDWTIFSVSTKTVLEGKT